jgi:hypothetical protein
MHATSNQALGRQSTGFGVMATGLAIAASVAVGAVIGINLASKAVPLAGATYSLITPSAAVDGPEDVIAAAKAPFVPKDEEVAQPNVVAGPGYDDQSYLIVPGQIGISYADQARGNAGWWASAPIATPGFDTASNAGSTYSAAANAGSSYLDGAEARHSRAMRTLPHRQGSTFLDGADQRHNPTTRTVDLSGVQRAGLD